MPATITEFFIFALRIGIITAIGGGLIVYIAEHFKQKEQVPRTKAGHDTRQRELFKS